MFSIARRMVGTGRVHVTVRGTRYMSTIDFDRKRIRICTADEAVSEIEDGATMLVGGFGKQVDHMHFLASS